MREVLSSPGKGLLCWIGGCRCDFVADCMIHWPDLITPVGAQAATHLILRTCGLHWKVRVMDQLSFLKHSSVHTQLSSTPRNMRTNSDINHQRGKNSAV